MIRIEKTAKCDEDKLRKRLQEEEKRKKKTVAMLASVSESSLAASLSKLNIDFNKAANDHPHPFSREVTCTKYHIYIIRS